MDIFVSSSPPNGELLHPWCPTPDPDTTMKLLWPQSLEGILRNGGNYDQVCAFDRKYPRAACNHKENRNRDVPDEMRESEAREDFSQPLLPEEHIDMIPISHTSAPSAANNGNVLGDIDDDYDSYNDLLPRHFGPRYICFLLHDSNGTIKGCKTRLVVN
ncbi:hypothetical protein PG994_002303 [Apiospora phragmitis]|uniref:Uncharacterized protein n=1 Tax=Apiospora phragmitis TaxID=2905665 RepID=A0ABR1WVZ0_9PEZI